jgi:hypothetical protein
LKATKTKKGREKRGKKKEGGRGREYIPHLV